jgi:hypothetical protein
MPLYQVGRAAVPAIFFFSPNQKVVLLPRGGLSVFRGG